MYKSLAPVKVASEDFPRIITMKAMIMDIKIIKVDLIFMDIFIK